MVSDYLLKINSFKKVLEDEIKKEMPEETIEVEAEEFGKKGASNGCIINFNIIKIGKKTNDELGNISVYTWKDKKEVNTKFESKEVKVIFERLSQKFPEIF